MVVVSCTGGRKQSDQWLKYSTPDKEGLSVDSLKKIDKLIQDQILAKRIPGGAAIVARDGKIVYEACYGYRDIASKTPLQKTDLFRITSMSKPLTTVSVLQLYEQGKLKLNDPLSKYIPSFSHPAVLASFNRKDSTWTGKPASREITLNDLLTHTSGICYGFTDTSLNAIYTKNGIQGFPLTADITIETTMSKLGKLPLAFEPGTKFTYGLSTDVLGRVVEIVSGMTLSDYINQNITGPLKMTDTHFFYDTSYTGRLTTAYVINPKDNELVTLDRLGIPGGNYPVTGSKCYFSGGSGMSSTLQDYFIFCQAILDGGQYNGVRILQDSTVSLMCSDHLGKIRWSDTTSFGYGLRIGWEKNPDGKPGRVIDLGWGGAFTTWFTINPSDRVIEIFMTQVFFSPFGNDIDNKFDRAVKSAYRK